MNPDDALRTAQALGLTLPGPGYIAGAILFSLLGLAAWRHGKVIGHARMRWLGVALMFYPYALGNNAWLLWAVGLALCGVIWWDASRR